MRMTKKPTPQHPRSLERRLLRLSIHDTGPSRLGDAVPPGWWVVVLVVVAFMILAFR